MLTYEPTSFPVMYTPTAVIPINWRRHSSRLDDPLHVRPYNYRSRPLSSYFISILTPHLTRRIVMKQVQSLALAHRLIPALSPTYLCSTCHLQPRIRKWYSLHHSVSFSTAFRRCCQHLPSISLCRALKRQNIIGFWHHPERCTLPISKRVALRHFSPCGPFWRACYSFYSGKGFLFFFRLPVLLYKTLYKTDMKLWRPFYFLGHGG